MLFYRPIQFLLASTKPSCGCGKHTLALRRVSFVDSFSFLHKFHHFLKKILKHQRKESKSFSFCCSFSSCWKLKQWYLNVKLLQSHFFSFSAVSRRVNRNKNGRRQTSRLWSHLNHRSHKRHCVFFIDSILCWFIFFRPFLARIHDNFY